MNEPLIMPVKPGSLKEIDKAKLEAIGVIVIEHDDPTSLKLISPTLEISGNELLVNALHSLNLSGATHDLPGARRHFFNSFVEIVDKQISATNTTN